MKKVKVDGMILATFLTTLFYASTYPFIHKQLMTQVSDNLIALNSIIDCVSVIVMGGIWNRWSKRIFKYYPLFCILETIVTVVIAVWVLQTNNLAAYYILNTLEFSVITRNMVCGGTRLRILRYVTEEEREHYTNNNNSADALATIIGSCIAMILHLPFQVMLILATFGNCIDNTFYLFIYYATVRKAETRNHHNEE
ncbi:MAG: hypothetical protein NC548_06055 [Lachnospiraceae bacterium]|nr:hypothetical protein [Lachnospiraceae bacterium]